MVKCAKFLCLLILILTTAYSAFAERKKILVIHSYHQGLVWTDQITKGIQSVFEDQHDLELHFEYLDTKRNPQESYRKKLAELYDEKVHTIPYEVIITIDNNALDFVRKYQDQYFNNIPVAFCGINHFTKADTVGIKKVTGVTENADYKSTLELIKKFHPTFNRLIVISDNKTTSSIRNREAIKALRKEYFQDMNMVFFQDFTIDQLVDSVANLGNNDIVMLLYFNKDKEGNYVSFKESIELISAVSKVPIYSSWRFHLGEGILGGMLTSGFAQGQLVAEQAMRIIEGRETSEVPIITHGYNRYAFDYNLLKRFNIDPNQLPNGAELINKPPDFFEKYEVYILISTGFIIVLIVAVFSITIRKKQNERKLLRINAELDRRVEQRTDELKSANEILTEQKKQISQQNEELEKHRHHLLELVDEKTLDLNEAKEKLERSYGRLMMMLETNSDGVWEHNLMTDEVNFSESFWKTLGYKYEDIIPRLDFVENLTHPEDIPLIAKKRTDYLLGKTNKFRIEFRFRTSEGKWMWFHAKGRTFKWNDKGEPEVMIGTHIDITPRKTAQEQLIRKNRDIAAKNLRYERLNQELIHTNKEMKLVNEKLLVSENRWRSLIQQVPNEIILHDMSGNILDVNPSTAKILGYKESELLQLNVKHVLPAFADQKLYTKYWKGFTAQKQTITFDTSQKRKDNSLISVAVTLSLIELNSKKYYLSVIHDISERQKTEREILNAVIETEENERKRFATDLHDSIGPLLSSINLSIAAIERAKESKKKEIIEVAKEAIQEAFHSIKEISNNLSPYILNDFGLSKAIKNFIAKLEVTESVNITFESNMMDKRLDNNKEVVLYRVVTELINNTLRHAEATKIVIDLKETPKNIELNYTDDGIGFDPEVLNSTPQTGMGFSNILSRLKSINGCHEISSKPLQGMSARIIVEH